MRVLFLHSQPAWTGSARIFDVAARGLQARQWEVVFVCPPGSAAETFAVRGGYEVIPLAEGGWAVQSWRLRRLLSHRFIEVAFVHTEREHLVAALALRLAERGAVVRRVPPGERLTVGRAGRLAARLAATGYFFAADEDREAAQRLPSRALEPVIGDVGIDVPRYDAVRPITASALGAPPSARLLTCVYGRTARRHAATVLRTLALLAPRHPELRLAILGDGSEHEDLHMHAAALGLTTVVTHLGVREDHLAVLGAADLGWVIADHDDGALGCLDLMALRVPVLAPRTTVTQRYVADGITGVLVPDEAPMTAARIASILAHHEQRTAMGNAGHARALREFPDTAMIDAFERAAATARERGSWRT